MSRSGTTLLKEMLDAHSALAIPSESYFIPQLWDRHRGRGDLDALLDDLRRLARLREWGVTPEAVRARLPERGTFADVVAAIYAEYAESRGKSRYGDKTPAYMEHLDLLEHVFPGARYVHLIRDGRDAALSFVAMKRRARFNWARPRGIADFACQWADEVARARTFGATAAAGRYLELRYEELVAEPAECLRRVCGFLGLPFEADMLDYSKRIDAGGREDHQRLAQAPTPGVRDWRREMGAPDAELFEAVAGELLAELGYERAHPEPSAAVRGKAALVKASYRARLASWRGAVAAARRSPVWRLRQVYIRRTAGA